MKNIYIFGGLSADGDGSLTELLGGKGAKLAEMTNLHLPVPQGCTIPTTYCVQYLNTKFDAEKEGIVLELVNDSVIPYLEELEEELGYMPLLSVRSGARVSMAGMMDTVLNVGITESNLQFWIDRLGVDAAWDCYRRFQMMYLNVVGGLDMTHIEEIIENKKEDIGAESDSELDAHFWTYLVATLEVYGEENGIKIPSTLSGQLVKCVAAVFDSWNTPRAVEYRKIHGYPSTWGTAVNIQRMVFGNLNNHSGSGVMFTRDPSTGENLSIMEYLPNAQGEDVVAGIRTPYLLREGDAIPEDFPITEEDLTWLSHAGNKLEAHFGDMQDIEFTIEDGIVYLLQTRDAKRSDVATVVTAWHQFGSEVWDLPTALSKITQQNVIGCIDRKIEGEPEVEVAGTAAGGSIVMGYPVYDVPTALTVAQNGSPVILVRDETTPDDIAAINVAEGILTRTGGLTSHAAVVARGMGKTCVVGCADLDYEALYANKGMIAINGKNGEVYFNCEDLVITDGEPPEELLYLAASVASTESVLLLGTMVDNTYVVDGVGREAVDIRREARKVDCETLVLDLEPTGLEYQKDMFGFNLDSRDYFNDQEHLFKAGRKNGDKFYLKAKGLSPDIVADANAWTNASARVLRQASNLDDLLNSQFVLTGTETLMKVFGTKEAMDVTLEALANNGNQLAQNVTDIRHPVEYLCSKVGVKGC